MMSRIYCLMMSALLISGCASHIPQEITSSPENDLSIAQARQSGHEGETVRWGGSIASVKNKEDQTWLEIVAKDLGRDGRPTKDDQSQGRFIAKVDQFLEPEIYNKGRLVTVVGQLTEKEAGKIGEQSYEFPVVIASKTWLWVEYKEPTYQRPAPYWPYDPYWDLRFRSRHFYGHPW